MKESKTHPTSPAPVENEKIGNRAADQFLPGKSLAVVPAPTLVPAAGDAHFQGEQVIADWKGSTEKLIQACIRIAEAIEAHQADKAWIDDFIKTLCKGHVLSAIEASRGLASPKLGKLIKLGKNAKLLQRPELSRLISGAHYSVLYQLLVMIETLPPQGEKEKAAEVLKIVRASPKARDRSGDLSRECLARETKRLKRVSKAAQKGTEAPSSTDGKAIADLISRGSQFDLLLLTPAPGDIARFSTDYADSKTLPNCLPFVDLLNRGAAGVVIRATIKDLPVIVGTVLPLCGHKAPSHVLLPKVPASSDILGEEIYVTAHRGIEVILPPLATPIAETESAQVAKALFPSAERCLHAFASSPTDGWETLIGEACWKDRPSIR